MHERTIYRLRRHFVVQCRLVCRFGVGNAAERGVSVAQHLGVACGERRVVLSLDQFDDRVANTALKGRTLLLLSLRGGSGEQTYFCPSPPRTWRGIGEGQLVSAREAKAGTIVELAEEFANLDQCVASDPEEPVSARSGGST